MKIKPFSSIILGKLYEEEVKDQKTGFVVSLPKDERFTKIEVLDYGKTVELPLAKGDIVICNARFEIIDPVKKIGFIHASDVLGKVIG